MKGHAVFVAALGVVACRPDLGTSDGLVTSPRILAVKAEPPEAVPGTEGTYTAMLAAPDASDANGGALWQFCTAPKSLVDDDVVSALCLGSASLVPAGIGSSIDAATPATGCSVFGPETPSAGARPRSPDVTGGYYQPLRIDWAGADLTFYLARIRCDLADAPADVAAEYASRYVPNSNPRLLPVVATVAGATASLSAISAGARVQLEAAWGTADVETYAYFDRGSQALSTKREAMRVAWYASGGSFATQSTGRDEADPMTTTSNTWTAPETGGGARLWLVLRDSRGGVDFATYDVRLVP